MSTDFMYWNMCWGISVQILGIQAFGGVYESGLLNYYSVSITITITSYI